jgi:hypothetical protein
MYTIAIARLNGRLILDIWMPVVGVISIVRNTHICPDLQIVVDPGNLVPRKNLDSKKVLSKIHALFAEN